ncbi:MAG: hypothetical protein LBU76_00795 [Azoarcus sp.]|jgi:plasmid stabilization system protein ParE|nr:hypothetical protein [Azoarcus sp.]
MTYRGLLTEEAKAELDHGIAYSKERWGVKHATVYKRELLDWVRKIVCNPMLYPITTLETDYALCAIKAITSSARSTEKKSGVDRGFSEHLQAAMNMKNLAGNPVYVFLFRFVLHGDGIRFVLNESIAEDICQNIGEKISPLVHVCCETLLRYKHLSISNTNCHVPGWA